MTLQSIDFLNAVFEGAAVIVAIINIRKILKDKCIHGITVISQVFYLIWAFWNVFFYFSYDTMFSFVAAALIALTYVVWMGLIIRYKYFTK